MGVCVCMCVRAGVCACLCVRSCVCEFSFVYLRLCMGVCVRE